MDNEINVFFPYYQCGDSERQKEIDLCIKQNLANPFISKLVVMVDDGSDIPFESNKLVRVDLESRPTYRKWVELTSDMGLKGVSILCNSDIYFDNSIVGISETLSSKKKFLALSRWELKGDETILHPNPHWSQDVWGINCVNEFSKEMLHSLEFPMGVPRCDNKIAYLFSIRGWKVYNPCSKVKSIHVHETELRTYDKKIDSRILGGVAYVYPSACLNDESSLDFDVWSMDTRSVNKVSLNKSMERWVKELAESKDENTEIDSKSELLQYATDLEFLNAMKLGEKVKAVRYYFEAWKYEGFYYFKNIYNLYRYSKISVDYDLDSFFSLAMIPAVLETHVKEITDKPAGDADLNFWQYPCATERQAYLNHLSIELGQNINTEAKEISVYVPLPWATYIDKKDFPLDYLDKIKLIISRYRDLAKLIGYELRVHSVCQHIHWIRILSVAKMLGITDIHLSHKDSNSEALQREEGYCFRLHGWSLIAVNSEVPERSVGMEVKNVTEKSILASFVGAHMPHYRDDSRIKLYEAAKVYGSDRVVVDLGREWHFNKIVYEEQVLNRDIGLDNLAEHDKKTFSYNSMLSESIFTLCPEGAGPNTLRFWEAISVGSIPVLFSDDLSVFSETSIGVELIENSIVWRADIDKSLFDYLSSVDTDEIEKKSRRLVELYKEVRNLCILKARKVSDSNYVKSSDNFSLDRENSRLDIVSEEKKVSILYVGASVTAQKNGYRPELNVLLQDRLEASVTENVVAIGATGSMFGLCNLNYLDLEGEYDLAIYEYSTGDLNVGLTPVEKVYDVVYQSLELLKAKAKRVLVVNNYREDYDGEKGDFIRLQYIQAANELGVPIANIYQEVAEYRSRLPINENWTEYYRDNVHTEPKGSRLVANYLCNHIYNLWDELPQGGVTKPSINKLVHANMHGIFLDGKEIKEYTYPSSKQKFNYISLCRNESVEFEFRGELWGVLSIVGPRSGVVRVSQDEHVIVEYNQFDRHCYYNRVQPRSVFRKYDDFVKIRIELLDKPIDINVASSTHEDHELPRVLNLSMLLGNNIDVKNFKVISSEVYECQVV